MARHEVLTAEVLAESKAGLSAEIANVRTVMAGLADELQRLEREERLLDELLRLRGVTQSAPNDSPGHAGGESVAPSTSASSLAAAVVNILRQDGKPLHIQELYRRVQQSSVPIPGQGRSANLIAAIRIHPDIVRPIRGIYGLREWALDDYAVRKTTTRRSAPKKRRRIRKLTPPQRS